jgi:hypothetical protein
MHEPWTQGCVQYVHCTLYSIKVEEPVTVTGGPMQRITAAVANIRTFVELLSWRYKSWKAVDLQNKQFLEVGREDRRQETADRFHCVWNSHDSTPDRREGGGGVGGWHGCKQTLAKLTNLYFRSLIHVRKSPAIFHWSAVHIYQHAVLAARNSPSNCWKFAVTVAWSWQDFKARMTKKFRRGKLSSWNKYIHF